MSKKLVKHGNSLALIIDKSILALLKIDEKTALDLTVKDDVITIKILGKNKAQDKSVLEAADRMINKYEKTFKALSKT